MRLAPLSVCLLLATSAPLQAQCRVPTGSNEARLLAWYAAPLVFSPAGVLGDLPPGGLRAMLEMTYIPVPGAALQRTSSCFRPKQEHSDIAPVLPRPRITLGLPGGLFVEVAYVPPVTVRDATPNLFSAGVGVVRPLRASLAIAVRAHLTVGSVEGPITCPAAELQLTDVAEPCYGQAPSKDRYRPNVFGVEGLALWSGGRVAAYGGVGVTSLRPRFTVGFQQANGYFDATRVLVDLQRVALLAGVRSALSGRFSLTGEIYSVPRDLTTLRVGGAFRMR